MKKLVCVLLVSLLAFALFACSSAETPAATTDEAPAATTEEAPAETAETPAETPAETEDAGGDTGGDSAGLKIGMLHFNVSANNYCSTYQNALDEYHKSDYPDVELINLDAQGDASVQLDQVNDMIQQDVDAVILWPVSGAGIIPGAQLLKDAGIPIVNSNSPIDKEGADIVNCYSGPDDYTEGLQAAEELMKAIDGKGKIVNLEGAAGYETAILRSKGLTDTLPDYPDVELLASEVTEWSTEVAQTVMDTFITKYGDEIDGVFCADDGISAGVMAALDAVGKLDGSVKITSCTLFASGYDAIKDGTQTASVLQSPILDAQLAMDLAVKLAKGETVEYDNRIQTFPVNADNIDEFDRPTW